MALDPKKILHNDCFRYLLGLERTVVTQVISGDYWRQDLFLYYTNGAV